MNLASSRSHCIFTISTEAREVRCCASFQTRACLVLSSCATL